MENAQRVVQPALIIGVGGSGIDIVRRFKRRFQLLYPDTPYVRLLGIDTAPQTEATSDVPRLTEDEFIHAANFQMEHFVGDNHIDGHPEIRDWWKGYDHLGFKFINMGAGQRRPVGRLALFVESGRVVDRLTASLFAIFNDRVFHALPPEYRRAVNVYIVTSTCGGTGTGMFMDLAYLTTHLVNRQMPQAVAWVRSLLLLPSVFIDTGRVADSQARASMRANAYGALAELDFAMSRSNSLSPVRYPNIGEVSRTVEPFRSCYLVGNRNAKGAVLTDFDEILERAAAHMQIELASPLTSTGEARMDNILASIRAKPEPQGKPRLYSSFHGDWLELPSRRVLARWTKMLAGLLLDRLRAPAQAGAGQELLRRLETSSAYGGLRSLISGHGLNRYMPSVQTEIDVLQDIGPEGEDVTTLVHRAQALQDAARRQIAGNAALPQIVEEGVRQVYSEVAAETQNIIAEGSLSNARQFLSAVEAELETWLSRIRADRGSANSDRWVNEFTAKAGHLKKGLLQRKERYVQEQRQLVIDAAEDGRTAWQQLLRTMVGSAAEDQLPGIIHSIRGLKERTEQLSTVIDAAAAEIARHPEPAPPAGMEIQFIGDPDIDRAFHENARVERMEAAASQHLRGLIETAQLSAVELGRRLLAAADSAVRTVAPEFLHTLAIPAAEIGARMNRLSPLAVFTAEWHARSESREVANLHLLGIPASMSGQRAAVQESLDYEVRELTEPVVHSDEERVVMTVQSHGFPLYALAEVRDCQMDYDASSPVDRVLRFVVPDEAVRHWGLLPVEAKEVRQWFAVGLAVGRVRQVGTAYVYNAGGARAIDIDLAADPDPGAARQTARDAFLHGGYSAGLKQALEARMRREGNQPLYDELAQWLAEQARHAMDPDYPEEAKQDIELVRSYHRSIRPI
jgi:hypothetical protein